MEKEKEREKREKTHGTGSVDATWWADWVCHPGEEWAIDGGYLMDMQLIHESSYVTVAAVVAGWVWVNIALTVC